MDSRLRGDDEIWENYWAKHTKPDELAQEKLVPFAQSQHSGKKTIAKNTRKVTP